MELSKNIHQKEVHKASLTHTKDLEKKKLEKGIKECHRTELIQSCELLHSFSNARFFHPLCQA